MLPIIDNKYRWRVISIFLSFFYLLDKVDSANKKTSAQAWNYGTLFDNSNEILIDESCAEPAIFW